MGASARRRLLAVTGGHRFDEPAFADLCDTVAAQLDCEVERVEQPGAQALLSPRHAGDFLAILLHDLPGLHLTRGEVPAAIEPTEQQRADVDALLAAGVGLVATHHALAGWPSWDGWADTLGGRFCYAPGSLDGQAVPASGYYFGRYTVEVASSDHPICAGVESFTIDDELYSCPVFTDRVETLLVTSDAADATFVDTYSEVVTGERRPVEALPSSSIVGWSHTVQSSRVVYLLPGHSAATLRHPMYQRLVANACAWAGDLTF